MNPQMLQTVRLLKKTLGIQPYCDLSPEETGTIIMLSDPTDSRDSTLDTSIWIQSRWNNLKRFVPKCLLTSDLKDVTECVFPLNYCIYKVLLSHDYIFRLFDLISV